MDKVGSSWELSAGRSSLGARQGKHELKFKMHEILFLCLNSNPRLKLIVEMCYSTINNSLQLAFALACVLGKIYLEASFTLPR